MDNITGAIIHHVCIQTANFDRAYRFYTEILGLSVIKEPFDFQGAKRICWIDGGSIIIELNGIKRGAENQTQPYSSFGLGPSHIAFVVDDLNATIRQLQIRHVRIVRSPFIPLTDDPHQPKVAFVEGPDGDHIEFRENRPN